MGTDVYPPRCRRELGSSLLLPFSSAICCLASLSSALGYLRWVIQLDLARGVESPRDDGLHTQVCFELLVQYCTGVLYYTRRKCQMSLFTVEYNLKLLNPLRACWLKAQQQLLTKCRRVENGTCAEYSTRSSCERYAS